MLLDAATGKEIRKPLQHGVETVFAITFSPDGTLVSTGGDATIKVWDMKSFRSTALPEEHRNTIYSAAFSPNGMLLVTASGVHYSEEAPEIDQGEVCLWNVKERKLLAKFHAHYGCVTSANFRFIRVKRMLA